MGRQTPNGAAEPGRDRTGSRPPVVLLTLLVAMGPVSTDVYLPSLPGIARDLQTSPGTAQLTVGLFIGGFAIMMLLAGPLADRYGRRPVLSAGLVLFTVASIACALSPTIEVLLVARFVQAVGACVGPVLGRAIVRDLYPPRDAGRVLGIMASAMAIAPMIGPVIGGLLEIRFGWQANFWFLTLYGGLLLLALRMRLEETLKVPVGGLRLAALGQGYAALLREPGYVGFVLAVSCSFGALFTWISNASFVIIDYFGVAPDWFALPFGLVILGYAVGGLIGGRLGMRFGLERATGIGTGIGVLAGLGLLLGGLLGIGGLVLIVLGNALAFFAAGLVMPQGTAGALVPFPQRAGSAAALLGFVQMMTGLLVNGITSAAFDGTPVPMVVTHAAMAGLSCLAWATLVPRAVITRQTPSSARGSSPRAPPR